jgi:hypothetical protein
MKLERLVLPAMFVVAVWTPVLAEDFRRSIDVSAVLGGQFDTVVDGDAGVRRGIHDLYVDSSASVAAKLLPGLSVLGELTLETVRPSANRGRNFSDQALYVQELFAEWQPVDDVELKAGKFNPGFGSAWDAAPGIYGADFAEGYEITEQVGIGGAVGLPGVAGDGSRLVLRGAAFFSDTSFLRESLFSDIPASDTTATRVANLRRSDGGIGNTERLDNFVAAADLDLPAMPLKPLLHLGFLSREAGTGATRDETGYALGLSGAADLGGGMTFSPVIEWASLNNFGGNDQDARFLTVAGALGLPSGFTLSAGITDRDLEEPPTGGPNGRDADDRLYTASVAYGFESGLEVVLGVKRERALDVDTDTVGMAVSYPLSASLPLD